jgi:hypothetical protein
MRDKKWLLFLFLLAFANNSTRGDSLYVYPSSYYTFGKYSTGERSTSISGYVTLSFNLKSFLTLGYDNLNLDYISGNYLQKNYTASFLQNSFPSYYKASYSHLRGEDNPIGSTAAATDNINLVSMEYYFFSNMFYFGIAGTYLNENNNLENLNVFQITPRIEWVLSSKLFLSLKPNYTYVSDKRSLFSIAGYVSWNASGNLYLKVGGFLGERALYFDTDLLTIYNQNVTQTQLYSVQLDYIAIKNTKLTAGYQRSKFSTYSINYFFVGLRTAFKLYFF